MNASVNVMQNNLTHINDRIALLERLQQQQQQPQLPPYQQPTPSLAPADTLVSQPKPAATPTTDYASPNLYSPSSSVPVTGTVNPSCMITLTDLISCPSSLASRPSSELTHRHWIPFQPILVRL